MKSYFLKNPFEVNITCLSSMGKSHFTGRNVLWNLLSYVFSILRFQSRLEFLEFKIHEKRFIRQFLWKYWIIGENIGKTICWRVQIEEKKKTRKRLEANLSNQRIQISQEVSNFFFGKCRLHVSWYFKDEIKKGRVWLTISYLHFCWGQGGTKCAIWRAGIGKISIPAQDP